MRRLAPTAATVVLALCLAAGAAADTSGDALIHADATRAFGYTGKGVTVAVLDTGIDDRDPNLVRSVVAERCFVPPDGCPNGTRSRTSASAATSS